MFLLGVATGMRSMTPVAVVCWFAWLGRLHVQGTWAFWTGSIASVAVFSLLALGEYVGDTLPRAPNRTALGPALARIVFGALTGAIVAVAYLEPVAGGITFGALGTAVGTWGGFHARRTLSAKAGRDLPIALLESALAIAISFAAMHSYLGAMNKWPVTYTGMCPPQKLHRAANSLTS